MIYQIINERYRHKQKHIIFQKYACGNIVILEITSLLKKDHIAARLLKKSQRLMILTQFTDSKSFTFIQ